MTGTVVVGLVVAVLQLVASIIAMAAAVRTVRATRAVKIEVDRLMVMRSEIELVRLEIESELAMHYQPPAAHLH